MTTTTSFRPNPCQSTPRAVNRVRDGAAQQAGRGRRPFADDAVVDQEIDQFAMRILERGHAGHESLVCHVDFSQVGSVTGLAGGGCHTASRTYHCGAVRSAQPDSRQALRLLSTSHFLFGARAVA